MVKDNYTGILKREEMIELEGTVIQIKEKDSQETEKEGDLESESESNERDESDEE